MVVRLECTASLLRSSREYWSRWRSQTPWVVEKTDCVFPFPSILTTWTAITLTGWLKIKWQVWADVSLHPCPHLRILVHGHIGYWEKKKNNPFQNPKKPCSPTGQSLPPPSPHSQPWCPCSYTWFLLKLILLFMLEPSGVVPAWSGLDGQHPCQWYALLSQFPVKSTPQSQSASAQQNQCFQGWSQTNK